MSRYNYNSESAQRLIAEINGYMRDKRAAGATLGEVAKMLGVSVQMVAHHAKHMVATKMIHIAVPASSGRGGHRVALYQFGPEPRLVKRKPAFANDALFAALYGKSK